jgi:hypothetical protein
LSTGRIHAEISVFESGTESHTDQSYLSPLHRNPGGLAALELNEMAARDSEKREQVSDVTPRQPAATICPDSGAVAMGEAQTVPDAMLGADLQAHIGRQLRAVYEEVVGEAVPDRFLKLLEELERKQAAQS